MDPGLEEAIASLLWATPRLQADVPELKAVSDQFTAKYTKEYAQACRTNQLNNVSEKVMQKLSVQAPPKLLVERYMMEIAKSYNVPFEPDPTVMEDDEILKAEEMLIDLDGKGRGGNSGGGGGLAPMQPTIPPQNAAFAYPPPQQVRLRVIELFYPFILVLR